MSVPLTPSADKSWITARWACLEESMARSLTVISLLLQSTTRCRYRVYTKFLLTYTAIYRGKRKVLPLGITALQPQSHFHLGTPYKMLICTLWLYVLLISSDLKVDVHRKNSSESSEEVATLRPVVEKVSVHRAEQCTQADHEHYRTKLQGKLSFPKVK